MRFAAPTWIAALLVVTNAVAAAAPSPGPGARTLEIEVAPAVVVLAPDGHESAEIRVRARDAAGQPVACDLRLGASVGSVGTIRSSRAGEYTATWRAPDERFPQVAILFAREPGGAFATHALPLHARVTIEGVAERHSQMSIAIDTRTFGPVSVGRSGQFAIEVEVPPGGRADGITIDRFGNQRRRAIDLGLPPFPRRLMAVAPDRLVADGVSQSEALVAAIDERGRPERGIDACRDLAIDAGSVSPPIERGPGACSARITAPVKVGRGAVNVRAAGVSARVALLPGKPRLAFDEAAAPGRAPRPLVEGGQRQLRLQARDDHGNPVPGLRLQASVDAGDGGMAEATAPATPAVVELGGGTYALDVSAPRDRDHLRIEVRAPDQPEVAAARIELPLTAPPPVELRLVVEPRRPRPGTAVTVRVLAGRGSPPSGAVWLEANGHVEPWRGSAAPEQSAIPCHLPGSCPPARRCWIDSAPPPRAGAPGAPGAPDDVELFQCRVMVDPERRSGELLIAATDGHSGAVIYRRIPIE